MAKAKLKHIHVEPNTDGTAQVRAHKLPPAHSNGPMVDHEANDEKVSGTPEQAGAHVTRMLKEHFGKSGPADDMAKHPARGAFGRGY